METTRITLPQEDKTTTTIFANLSEVTQPIGSVLLLHDMAEHHGRFEDFVHILNMKGYDTYSFDYRGHGSGIRYEELGFIAEENGHELLISDALHILKYIKKNNRGRKTILFGQGAGALIARCVIQAYDNIDACILCSSPNPTHKYINSLLTAAKFIKFRKKAWYRSDYMAKKLTEFKSFTRISNRTAFDWVSRDNQLVGSYISDPLCSFLGTVSFYIDILNLTDEAVSKANLKQIRNDLPILLLAGSHDPVCDYGNDAADLFDTFQRYHFTEVDCTIYEEARHDLLHETNNAAIIKDILEWLNKALDNRRLKAVAAMKEKNKKKKGKNRTAAEAARSALGYASASDEDKGSIQADNVGDDDAFLSDMGYFNRSSDYDEAEEDEDFIIMDDDDDIDALARLEAEEELEFELSGDNDDAGNTAKKNDSSNSKDKKEKKNGKKDKKAGTEAKNATEEDVRTENETAGKDKENTKKKRKK
ncbi:MAG: alpha/beta hydrolase [Lachnospiraceae bacterium]|nr:alpha/beta hydrolase [Lachnospiraceae bacterium]